MKISLEGVSARHLAAKAGATPSLQALNLQIASGEQVAVIGPSGAGKTTLLEVLACTLPPIGGAFRLGEQVPWQLSSRQRHRLRGSLFLAPQTPPLPPRQRVVTAVLAGRLPAMGVLASLWSLIDPIDVPAARGALIRFDLEGKLYETVDRLSGGERQRVGLARALLAPARLWLVDEPLSSLDQVRAQQALSTLKKTANSRGITLVTTLHQVDAALAYFPRIVGLRDGQIAFDLPTPQVTRNHLEALYEQHEDELRGDQPASVVAEPVEPPVRPIFGCR